MKHRNCDREDTAMIDKKNIVYGERIYYVPQYGSPNLVSVLQIFPDGFALVDPSTAVKHRRSYVVAPEFLCETFQEANSLFHQWEGYRKAIARQRKRERNKVRKRKEKTEK